MKRDGHITVFLSLILVSVCSLILGMAEVGRTAGARCYAKTATYSAMDSLFSQYHREVWDKYRIAMLECSSEQQLGREIRKYMDGYFEADSFFPLKWKETNIKNMTKFTDSQGKYLEEEILSFMKYGMTNFSIAEEDLQKVSKYREQADSLFEINKIYAEKEKKIIKLEKAALAINQSFIRQGKLYQQAMGRLREWNGPAFCKQADSLLKEMESVPELIHAYESKLEQLTKEIKTMYEEIQQNHKKRLDEENWIQIENELVNVNQYISDEIHRKQEIQKLNEKLARNKLITEQAIEEAIEVQQIIDDWDADSDEDGPDEEALWNGVIRTFSQCDMSQLVSRTGIGQPEKQAQLEEICSLLSNDWLTYVVPEGCQISNTSISQESFPSLGVMADRYGKLSEQWLVAEYCTRFCTSFLSEERKDFQYEVEYLLQGNNNDRKNLSETVKNIMMFREGMNFLYLLSDEEKMAQASSLAATITGVTGSLPLTQVVKFFILGVWAKAEAISDLRTLLDGEKVVFMKTKTSWNVQINEIFNICSERRKNVETQENGMDYQGYLKILLLLEKPAVKLFRLMDMIQLNIKREQPDFLISDCLYSLEIENSVAANHVFTSLWRKNGTYNFVTKACRSY